MRFYKGKYLVCAKYNKPLVGYNEECKENDPKPLDECDEPLSENFPRGLNKTCISNGIVCDDFVEEE
jgi:hypothetical protein